MPNYVRNKLEITGEQAEIMKFLEFVKNENMVLDFNKLIPMPKSLEIESGSRTENSLAAYKFQAFGEISERLKKAKDRDEEAINLNIEQYVAYLIKKGYVDLSDGRKAYENIINYGYKDWYEWAIHNWGTKWNACESAIVENNVLVFDTAWSAPLPIVEKMAELFPMLGLHHVWADECLGMNEGEAAYGACDNYCYVPEEFSPDALRIYCDCWGKLDCIP